MAFRDIRKSRKWLSAQEIRILLLISSLLLGLLAANLYAARLIPGGEWLYLRWSGMRAFLGQLQQAPEGAKYARLMPDGAPVKLVAEVSPYGRAIAQGAQQIVYGRIAFASEYRYVLNDPFYIILLYTPLALFQDFSLARGLWMFFSEIAVVFIMIFAFRLSEWEPPVGLYILLIFLGLLSFFSLNALVTASPSIFLTLLYLGILLALRSFSDELAGALLFLTAYQWEVSALFFLFLLIFVFANRRWHVLLGFGMALMILLVISFLVDPGWGLPYIRAVISNIQQGLNLNLNHILSGWLPNVPVPVGRVISLLAIALVLIESAASAQAPFRRVFWTACLALAATPLTGLAMFTSNYVVLLLPFLLVLALIWERWERGRIIRIAFVLLLVILVPYGLYLRTVYVYAPFYTELLAVVPPLTAIITLYWMRWWVIRSPRIWADQIGRRR